MPSVTLPKIMNYENETETVTLVVEIEALRYVDYDPDLPGLFFKETTQTLPRGQKDINFKITLKDDHPSFPMKKDYEFKIMCLYCKAKAFKPVFKSRNDGQTNKLAKINFNELLKDGEVPVPPVMIIKPMTSLGKLTISFSKGMEYPSEIKEQYKNDKKEWDAIFENLMNPKEEKGAEEGQNNSRMNRNLRKNNNLINFFMEAGNPGD